MMAGGLLEGIRVLELGSEISAPFCARLLADYGAEVIKVEPPGQGDPARPPYSLLHGGYLRRIEKGPGLPPRRG